MKQRIHSNSWIKKLAVTDKMIVNLRKCDKLEKAGVRYNINYPGLSRLVFLFKKQLMTGVTEYNKYLKKYVVYYQITPIGRKVLEEADNREKLTQNNTDENN